MPDWRSCIEAGEWCHVCPVVSSCRSTSTKRSQMCQLLVQLFCTGQNAQRVVKCLGSTDNSIEVSAAMWLMQSVIHGRAQAERFPNSFTEYFQVLFSCLQHLSRPEEVWLWYARKLSQASSCCLNKRPCPYRRSSLSPYSSKKFHLCRQQNLLRMRMTADSFVS